MNFAIFDIGFETLNLFSFMLGMTFAFFQQGLFGKRMGKYIIGYFVILALVYGLAYYGVMAEKKKANQSAVFVEVPK